MRTHPYSFYILVSCCYISCTNSYQYSIDSDFSQKRSLTATDSINLESKDLLLPFSVTSIDSYFIFSSIRTKQRVSVLNRGDGTLTNAIYTGDGPDEIIQYLPVGTNENKFLFADRVRGKIFELEFKNNNLHKFVMQFSDSINRFFSLAKIDSTLIIGTGLFDKGRFLIYDTSNHTYKYEEEYPTNQSIETLSSYQKAALFAGTLIGVHPDGNKLVVAYNGLIDFYTIGGDKNLLPVMHRYYHYPLFAVPEKGPVIAHKKEETTGFLSLCYNSSYIYLLYSQTSMQEKGGSTFSGNTILVYDWSGVPIKGYVLDHNLLSICVEGDKIWGVDESHRYLYQYVP